MRFRTRIKNIEKLIPVVKTGSEVKEIERVSEWLAQNSEEFRECVRQLFRLQCKIEGFIGNVDEIEQPYRQKAEAYMIRINQLIDQHRESVTV